MSFSYKDYTNALTLDFFKVLIEVNIVQCHTKQIL